MADFNQAQASGIAPHTVLTDTQPRSMTVGEIQKLAHDHVIAAKNAKKLAPMALNSQLAVAQVCKVLCHRYTTSVLTNTAAIWSIACGL